MGKQKFDRIKKTIVILLSIFFVATLTAVSASAQSFPNYNGPRDHPNIRWDGHKMWDDDHHWRWDGHNWWDNDHNWRWDGHNWWDNDHNWRWDGNRWWNGNTWWNGHKWQKWQH